MQSKLHIDISEGVVDVEGDPELIREVYRDFKDRLLTAVRSSSRNSMDKKEGADPGGKAKAKRQTRTRVRATTKETPSGTATDSPKMDKNLDTRKLSEFFARFKPNNNPEKILIYLKFMIDELGIPSPNTDQVFTCFKATNQKIPGAFIQAFHTTSSRHGFIDFKSATDFPITIAGENHFNHNLERTTTE